MLFEKILAAPAAKIANRIADDKKVVEIFLLTSALFDNTKYRNASAAIIADVPMRMLHTTPDGESKMSDRTVDRY
jgi:hypothetical protein